LGVCPRRGRRVSAQAWTGGGIDWWATRSCPGTGLDGAAGTDGAVGRQRRLTGRTGGSRSAGQALRDSRLLRESFNTLAWVDEHKVAGFIAAIGGGTSAANISVQVQPLRGERRAPALVPPGRSDAAVVARAEPGIVSADPTSGPSAGLRGPRRGQSTPARERCEEREHHALRGPRW
jgi:hypothetical protein